MRRSLTSLVVVIALVGTATAARGQSEDDVAEARRVAEAVTAAHDGATTDTVEAQRLLREAVREYGRLTAAMTDVSFDLAAVIEATRTREAAYRRARDEAQRLVTAAYVSGAVPPTLLDAAGVGEIAFAEKVRASVAAIRSERFVTFDVSTAELDVQRGLLEQARTRVAALRDAATAMVPQLEALLRDAEVAETFWADQRTAAVAAYQLEVAELEAALALVSPRALLWRELVATHFPEAMLWAALQVLDCESGGDPDAVNDESGSVGLFQFLEGTWLFASAGAGFAGADRTDPEANVASAAWLVARSEALDHPRGAWGHWVCQPDAELMESAQGRSGS